MCNRKLKVTLFLCKYLHFIPKTLQRWVVKLLFVDLKTVNVSFVGRVNDGDLSQARKAFLRNSLANSTVHIDSYMLVELVREIGAFETKPKYMKQYKWIRDLITTNTSNDILLILNRLGLIDRTEVEQLIMQNTNTTTWSLYEDMKDNV